MIHLIADKLRNLAANLGTDRDKSSYSEYTLPMLDEAQIINAYRGSWLPRKVVDIPAYDAFRKWRYWQATKDQITAIEGLEQRFNLQSKCVAAKLAARLYGGAALYFGINGQSPSSLLDPETVGLDSIKYISVLTPHLLKAEEDETDPASEYYNTPYMYTLNTQRRLAASGPVPSEVRIHPSRLVRFIGAPVPQDGFQRGGLYPGWGDSVLLAVYEALRTTDATVGSVASLVFEAKIDVMKIPGLMMNVADERYRSKVVDRMSLAALMKSNNGALIMDAEEGYEQKAYSFSGLEVILDRFFQVASGAADIPITRLMGQSPAGLNASGESDIRNYYDRVQSTQELEITPAMRPLDECLIRSALGLRPPEIFYKWASLWQTTEKDRADVGKTIADTAVALSTILPREAVSQATANALIEFGSLPGLEAAVEEFGTEPPELPKPVIAPPGAVGAPPGGEKLPS